MKLKTEMYALPASPNNENNQSQNSRINSFFYHRTTKSVFSLITAVTVTEKFQLKKICLSKYFYFKFFGKSSLKSEAI